jgi:hypothetical protein
MKDCLNCGRFGYADWDKEKQFPMCAIDENSSVDVDPETMTLDREGIDPGQLYEKYGICECEWFPVGQPLPKEINDDDNEDLLFPPPKPVAGASGTGLSLREKLKLKRLGKRR